MQHTVNNYNFTKPRNGMSIAWELRKISSANLEKDIRLIFFIGVEKE